MDEFPQVLDSRVVYDGRVFRVRSDDLRYEDESVHRCDVVEHAPTFGIIALLSHDEIVLVRQYRHPARRYFWEIPAGTAEKDERAADGAARELAEETGYRAARIQPLGTLYMTPGFCDEAMHFFVAEELAAGEQALDEDERIAVAAFPRDRAWDLVAAGEIADVKTLLSLYWMGGSRGQFAAPTRR
jgi:ADP-ribose pyrophosphatase